MIFSKFRDHIRPYIPRLRQTCAECGYLVTNYASHEVIDSDRRQARVFEPSTHCYRRIWTRGKEGKKFKSTGEVSPSVTEVIHWEANRTRICGSFFPFSDGTPLEHRDSHRARSTRRWLIGASLVAPYGAATSAILVGDLTRMEGFRIWVAYGLLIGSAILVFTILALNRFFVRN